MSSESEPASKPTSGSVRPVVVTVASAENSLSSCMTRLLQELKVETHPLTSFCLKQVLSLKILRLKDQTIEETSTQTKRSEEESKGNLNEKDFLVYHFDYPSVTAEEYLEVDLTFDNFCTVHRHSVVSLTCCYHYYCCCLYCYL